MPCKFSRDTVCSENFIKLFDLPIEDAEIALSEHGFLSSPVTLAFEVCEYHLRGTQDDNKRRWANNSKCAIPLSIAIHGKGNKFSGNRKITRDIMKRIHSLTGVVVPIGGHAKQNAGQIRVKVVDTITNVDTRGKPIPNISHYFNFIFEENGLRVYKAYKIGKGELLPWNSIGTSPKSTELLVILDWANRSSSLGRSINSSEDATCSAPKRRKLSEVFDCTKDGCTKTFNSSQALENHLLLGDCNYNHDLTSHDKAKSLYGSKVNDLFSNETVVTLTGKCREGHSHLLSGWALKSKKKRGSFTDKQRDFIKEKFYCGKRTGSKVDPYRASMDMRNLKVGDKYVFSKEEYLTGQQISSYFSRLALKDRNLEIDDFKPAEEETCKAELKSNILKDLM